MVPDLWSARFQGFRKTILQLNMKFNKNKLHAFQSYVIMLRLNYITLFYTWKFFASIFSSQFMDCNLNCNIIWNKIFHEERLNSTGSSLAIVKHSIPMTGHCESYHSLTAWCSHAGKLVPPFRSRCCRLVGYLLLVRLRRLVGPCFSKQVLPARRLFRFWCGSAG